MEFVNTLIGAFLGAMLAFISNICLKNRQEKENNLLEFSILWINYLSLLNNLIYFKKHDAITRSSENIQLKENLQPPKSQNQFNKLFQFIIISELKIYTNLLKLGFITNLDPDLYLLILTLDKSIKNLNADIDNLNKCIDTCIVKGVYIEHQGMYLKFLTDYTDNVMNTLDTCISLLVLGLHIISILGKKEHGKKFKFTNYRMPQEYKELIPKLDYIEDKGFGNLANKYKYSSDCQL